MDFQTKVELPAGLPPVSHAERILLMGSCFAENMGRLRDITSVRNAGTNMCPHLKRFVWLCIWEEQDI